MYLKAAFLASLLCGIACVSIALVSIARLHAEVDNRDEVLRRYKNDDTMRSVGICRWQAKLHEMWRDDVWYCGAPAFSADMTRWCGEERSPRFLREFKGCAAVSDKRP